MKQFWTNTFFFALVIAGFMLPSYGVVIWTVMGLGLTALLADRDVTMLRISRKTKKIIELGDVTTNRSVDVTSEGRAVPLVLGPAIKILYELGFRWLGECAVYTAEDKELGTQWNFASADNQTIAGLVTSKFKWCGFFAEFSTVYPDYAWLITTYPTGFPKDETFNLPDFRFHHQHKSLRATYEHHQKQVDDFARLHGAPLQPETMESYLELSPIFRQRYGRLTLRRPHLFVRFNLHFFRAITLLVLLATTGCAFAPGPALVVMALSLSTRSLYAFWTVPTHPFTHRVFHVGLGLLLVLCPLSILVSPAFGGLHVLGVMLLTIAHERRIKPEARSFSNAIKTADDEGLERIRQQHLRGE